MLGDQPLDGVGVDAEPVAGHDGAERREVAYQEATRDVLLAGRGLCGARRGRVRAAIGLALTFETWQGLTREGLTDDEAVELMAGAVAAA